MVSAAFASQFRRARTFVDALSREADESLPEMVEVRDPTHPLFGRRFTVLRRLMSGTGGLPPSYEVEYINGSSLIIPILATEQYQHKANQLKLSIDSLTELLVIAEGLGPNDDRSKGPVGIVTGDSAAPDRRRSCCGNRGDLP
jgi:hypothetical protein